MRRRVVVRRAGVGLLGAAAIGGTAYALGSRKRNQYTPQYSQPAAQPVTEPIPVQVVQTPQQSAQTQSSPSPEAPLTQEQKIAQLKELGELQKSGILTPEEFEREKKKILDQ